MLKTFVIDAWFVKKDHHTVLYRGFENEKKKGKKKIDLPERGFEPRIFEQLIWIFMEGEGDEIKYRQPSKRDRTLICSRFRLLKDYYSTDGVRDHKGFLQIWLRSSGKKRRGGPYGSPRIPTLEQTNKA